MGAVDQCTGSRFLNDWAVYYYDPEYNDEAMDPILGPGQDRIIFDENERLCAVVTSRGFEGGAFEKCFY